MSGDEPGKRVYKSKDSTWGVIVYTVSLFSTQSDDLFYKGGDFTVEE